MNREKAGKMAEVMKAYAEGMEVEFYCAGNWESLEAPDFNFAKNTYRIKPIKRYMTRNEVLTFVTFSSGLIVRYCGYSGLYPNLITPASSNDYADYEDDPAKYEWAYAKFDDNGEPTGGWHKFEVEL